MAEYNLGKVVGPQGAKGDTGAVGPQGPTGATGPQGPRGETGARGPQGAKGDTGATGPQGVQGATGPKGDTGQRGSFWYQGTAITGTNPTGTVFGGSGISSALVGDKYLNTSNGNVYNCTQAGNAGVAKWAYAGNIRGLQGAQGPQGVQGVKGDTGATGPQGPKGDTGAQGAAGPKGEQGLRGETDPKGDKGDTGAAGATGPAGPNAISAATTVSGIANGQFLFNNNGKAGGKAVTPASIGAAAASHTHTKSQITDFPTALKNPTALTLQLNGTNSQVYDGAAAKTFNVTASAIGALGANQPSVSAPKSTNQTFAVNFGRIVSPDNRGIYIRNANQEGSGVFVGVREEFQSFTPDHNTSGGASNLGAPSYRWRVGYFVNQPNVSSDKNMKEQIEPLSEKQMRFFELLKPVQYKLKGSSHDRLHYGFIAQEVEQAMRETGIGSKEFGGFCKDRRIQTVKQFSEAGEFISETEEEVEGYDYSLRYGEFIALNTAAIQALKKEISALKAEINQLKGV